MSRIAERWRSAKTSRDPHWDNIRFLSGSLIVLVHVTAPLLEATSFRWIYIATWAFRVPVFALIAGYFSSAGPLTARDTRKLTETVLVPYLVLGLLHTLQVRYYTGEWTLNVEEPAWAMWFLLSLLMWRMMLPYLARLRYPMALSVLAALAAGYLVEVEDTFAASQTLAFLPFFLLGWKIREGWGATALRARWSWFAAWGVIVTTVVAGLVFVRDIPLIWLAMRRPYEQETLPVDLEWAWVVRAGVILVGVVAAVSFVRVVPRRRLPFLSYLGAGGFYIYLLHPLVLRAWNTSGPGVGWVDSRVDQVLVILMAIGLSALLASPPVRTLARPIIQPRLPWLFREQTTTEKGAAGDRPEKSRDRALSESRR